MRGAPGLDLICGQTKALQWGQLRNIDKNALKKKWTKLIEFMLQFIANDILIINPADMVVTWVG